MQLFAGLMLDGRRVVLKLVNVLAQTAVLLFQLLRLDLQFARFFAFVGKGCESVMTEDNTVSHHNGEYTCTEGRHLAARLMSPERIADTAPSTLSFLGFFCCLRNGRNLRVN